MLRRESTGFDLFDLSITISVPAGSLGTVVRVDRPHDVYSVEFEDPAAIVDVRADDLAAPTAA